MADTVVLGKIAHAVVALLLLCSISPMLANTVHHKEGGRKLRTNPNAGEVQGDLRAAVAAVLGNGHGIETEYLQGIQQKLVPMWDSLPKNTHGRVDRATFRYALQRYFLKTFSLSIVGLEPLQVNGSMQEAALLTNYAPSYVRTMLEGKAATHGFSLEDAVAMAATLEFFVAHATHGMIEEVYATQGKDVRNNLNRAELQQVLESYVIRWMIGDDAEAVAALEANKSLRPETFEDWDDIQGFAFGAVTSMEHWRSLAAPNTTRATGDIVWRPMQREYSFDDTQEVVSDIVLQFGRFWETECSRIKDLLVDMDYDSNGRVKVAHFYDAAMHGEWRFSESKEYLRGLGALDETSTIQGPQVIITNYIQGASNCIVSAEHYRVCCVNECEDILGEIEARIRAPVASPEVLLEIVKDLTISIDDKEARLTSALHEQLDEITRVNNGKVPLHGRLFSQWLHFVFPHHCPFPHKAGTTIALTPLEFGIDYMASEAEMEIYSNEEESADPQDNEAVEGKEGSVPASREDDWMSQWTHEEELLANPTTGHSKMHWPWLVVAFIALVGLGIKFGQNGGRSKEPLLGNLGGGNLPTHIKSHIC